MELQLGLALPLHTLPLLSPNHEDQHNPKPTHKEDEDSNRLLGWPPLDSWRTKATLENHSLFVKVKMEGVAITRKLDLTLYHSHSSLKNAVIAMFAPYRGIDRNSGWDFTVIYEDKDGDWLLAEDLPWNSFVESVQRLKILVRKRNEGE